MFILHADKNKLTLRNREPVTSGSVNVYPVRFEFSPDWDGLQKTAVFRAGNGSVSLLLNDSNKVVNIPWEVLRKPGIALQVGIYGTRGEDEVLPTVWANMGVILEGAEPGEIARPPTPDLWQQELAGKADGMKYDGLNLHLKSGEKTLSTVRIVSNGGDGSSTTDHRLLTGRDAERQHPMSSIDGLTEEIKRIPAPIEALTNLELEELLK